jgi:hypothetical protein
MKPLLEFVSVSIREDIITTMLKKAVVKPIYKKGAKDAAKNYGQIIVVLALLEILEK